jgi:hypothetical protein
LALIMAVTAFIILDREDLRVGVIQIDAVDQVLNGLWKSMKSGERGLD